MGTLGVLYDLDRERGVLRIGQARLFTLMMELLEVLQSTGKSIDVARFDSCFDREAPRLLGVIDVLEARAARVPELMRECDVATRRVVELTEQLVVTERSFDARYFERLLEAEAELTRLQAIARQQLVASEGLDQEHDRLRGEATRLRDEIEALQSQNTAEEYAIVRLRAAQERRSS
jgi:hypothetical protein